MGVEENKQGSMGEDIVIIKAYSEKLTILRDEKKFRHFMYNTSEFCTILAEIFTLINDREDLILILEDSRIFKKALMESRDFLDNFIEHSLLSIIQAGIKLHAFQAASLLIGNCVFAKKWQVFGKDSKEEVTADPVYTKIISFLVSLYSLTENECANAFHLLFDSFCRVCKKFSITHRFYVSILQLIGFDINAGLVTSSPTNLSLTKSLGIVDKLLEVLDKCKIDNNSSCDGLKFSDFQKNLATSIMGLCSSSNKMVCSILTKMIVMEPILAEEMITELITCFMINNEGESREEYENLMTKVLEVFRKLHGIQTFISKMIPILKDGLNQRSDESVNVIYTFRGERDLTRQQFCMKNAEVLFPAGILNCFTDGVTTLVTWQIINLFKTLLYHLSKAVEEIPPNDKGNVDFIFLEIISLLTGRFLTSVRMYENTIPHVTLRKFNSGLDELKEALKKFGKTLLQREYDQVLMKSFLSLCHIWGEVSLTLTYYTNCDDVKLKLIQSNDYSAWNLSIIHSYLSEKEWAMIAERIKNFSPGSCQDLMNKLVVQKLKASMVIENELKEEILNSIVQYYSSSMNSSSNILTDKFILNTLVPRMSETTLLDLARSILPKLMDENLSFILEADNELVITKALLNVIFSCLNVTLVQKRKLDQKSSKKSILGKILSLYPANFFLENVTEDVLARIVETLDSKVHNLDLEMQDERIERHLNVLLNIPLIFCEEKIQKCVILMLYALHIDCNKKCPKSTPKIESLISGIVYHNKFHLLDLFEANQLLKLMMTFEKNETFRAQMVYYIFKDDQAIKAFASGIDSIRNNIDQRDYLKFSVIVCNALGKAKKMKLSQESKESCAEYRNALCKALMTLTVDKDPGDDSIEPFGIALKHFLSKSENLKKFNKCIGKYLNYSLENPGVKGALLLFVTVLNKKSELEVDDSIASKIWKSLKNCTVNASDIDDYLQVIILIVTQIENDELLQLLQDLEKNTYRSVENGKGVILTGCLQTWSCILSTDFNSSKREILQECLQRFVQKLTTYLQNSTCDLAFLRDVVQLQVKIIQNVHVPLTSVMVDLFLLTVTILTLKPENFSTNHRSSMDIMENLLKYRSVMIMDRLPPYLLQYKHILREICYRSNSDVNLNGSDVRSLANCAHNLEQLTKNLVAHTKDMKRIAPYVIQDILGQFERNTLYPSVKMHLDNCLYSLISLCDYHAVKYLMRILSNASTEIFKMMYDNYKRYHRFTGKV